MRWRGSPQGVSNIVMTKWGLHLYYNITSLVERRSVDANGFPWQLAENAALPQQYAKGTCPVADSLFERSIIMSIPSCLTPQDEVRAFEKVLAHFCQPAKSAQANRMVW